LKAVVTGQDKLEVDCQVVTVRSRAFLLGRVIVPSRKSPHSLPYAYGR